MRLKNRLSKKNPEGNEIRTLYLVMEKVGGYEQLMNLTLPSLGEIIKCMEYFNKEESKKEMRKR